MIKVLPEYCGGTKVGEGTGGEHAFCLYMDSFSPLVLPSVLFCVDAGLASLIILSLNTDE